MKKHKTIEEITDKEVESYIRLQDFNVGRKFIASIFVVIAIGMVIGSFSFVGWGIVILAVLRFVLLPLFTNIMAPITKKHDPKGYREYLDFKKREYHKKYYQ